MKLIYIAGAYSGNTIYQTLKNIRRAEEVNEWAWSHGISAICPHTNTRFLDGLCNYKVFAEGYLELLRKTKFDFMVLVPGYQDSPGTKEEIKLAKSLEIPIYKYGDAFHNLYTLNDEYVDLEELLAE